MIPGEVRNRRSLVSRMTLGSSSRCSARYCASSSPDHCATVAVAQKMLAATATRMNTPTAGRSGGVDGSSSDSVWAWSRTYPAKFLPESEVKSVPWTWPCRDRITGGFSSSSVSLYRSGLIDRSQVRSDPRKT